MNLPYFHTVNKDLVMLQNKWKSILDILLGNPLNAVNILPPVKLATGANVINHLLQRKQQGWFLVDIQGPATIYRSADFNDLTLTLTTSADVTITLGVY